MSNDPEFDKRLGRIAQMVPGMIRQLHQQKHKIITGNGGGVHNAPCNVCGKPYGSPFIANKNPSCKSCRKMLKAGCCGFITLGSATNGARYALAALDGMPEAWKGNVRVVSDAEMDHIEKLIKEASSEN